MRTDGAPRATASLERFAWRPFGVLLALLALVYGTWLVAFWPGVLGQDSLAILLEVQNPAVHHSGKPDFWYGFVRLLYAGTQRVEVPIAVLLLLTALVFARLLAWQWQHGLRKTTAVLLLLVCAAPQMVFFAGSLYPDGYYAVAVTGLLFELWRAVRARRMDASGLVFVALTLPFAAFLRPNGIVFLLPVALALWWVQGRGRLGLGVIALSSIALNMAAGQGRQEVPTHSVLYPLAIYETANFLQPRPMNLWTASPRVHPDTVQLLKRHGIYEKVIAFYDPDYWDPLTFRADGPRVMGLPKDDRKAVVEQFFTYNLWHNMPKFVGSRVNLLLVAGFAQGGLPSHSYAAHVLQQIETKSRFRKTDWLAGGIALFTLYEWSFQWRWLLWTPFVGVALAFWALWAGWQRRDRATVLVAAPMVLQFGAITVFSIAGEYRYLLPFFTLTVLWGPLWLGVRSKAV
ncbi:hypothetical protein [Acidovorax lacteus]|uniref:Glycosyltransferase RgtA/B/C/D-like domain-containing protein n=1 Tax=Acidovorax lacteus TaxID=1924988 RepID=A0ABP8L8H6_9BURK